MTKQLYYVLLFAAFWGGISSFVKSETIEHCPKSCQCTVSETSDGFILTIEDCPTEPSSELYKLLHLYVPIVQLKMINASLSRLGDISYLDRLSYLDLRQNHLTSFPCELSKLPTLSELNLSHNDIQTVECDMSKLVELKNLFLNNNILKSVPCELSKLPALSQLMLSDNDIQTVDCDMSHLEQLTHLNIEFNKLKSLPCELSKIPNLWKLELAQNVIQTVDCDMSQLVGLEELDLTNNSLKSVPCELSKLPKLHAMVLSHNVIQTVDCDMSQLEQLQYLYLDSNDITLVPCELSKIPNLCDLDLIDNHIQTVDCDMSRLEQLQSLFLSKNHLKSVPCELSKMPKLSMLYLPYNDIQTVDCDMSQLKQLKYLFLSNNNLKSVPYELSKLPTLRKLTLSYNDIQTVDWDMSPMEELEELSLDYNNLKSVPCELSRLPRLSYLALSNNDIQTVDCDLELKGLLSLYLDNNKLKSIPNELSKLANLRKLQLSHNDIQTVDWDMSHLEQLSQLYLDYNKLMSVPCELSKLLGLVYLGLSNNDIRAVDCDMAQLVELGELYLNNNSLASLPCELSKLHKLTQLHLQYNDIHTVDCDMSHLEQLEYLYLDYNNLNSVPCELSKLPKLSDLCLSHNGIQTVDCNMSHLQQLETLDLSYNKLTTLTLLLGIQQVDVNMNAIMQFTNKAGLKSSCKDLPSFNLQGNNITHLMDIFVGWGLPINETNDLGECIGKLTEHFSGNPLVCDCIDYRFYHFLQRTGSTWDYICHSPVNLQGQNPVTIPVDQFVCRVRDQCPVGCTCVSVPGAHALRVSCEAYTRSVLPQNLPFLENGSFYEFDIQMSHLASLPFRSYFVNTTKAIFSHSSITKVPMATLKALGKNIKVLHFNSNQLQWLPGNMNTIQFKHLVEICLDNNPWDCGDCRMLELREFIIENYHIIKNVDLIRCHSPPEVVNRRVLNVDSNIFCHKKVRDNTFPVTAIATSGALLLVVSVTMCILKRRKVKDGVAVNVQQQNGGVDDIEDEGKKFDIFMSYATDDEEYAGEWLIPELEKRGFKVCFHRVHFLGGVPIHVNMYECINKSKRMLAFFSKNFVDSTYSMYEFDLALGLDIDGGTKRLVTIKEATLDIKKLEPSYGSYFRTHTYIEQGAVNFWENLLETMPQNKLGVVADHEVNNHDG